MQEKRDRVEEIREDIRQVSTARGINSPQLGRIWYFFTRVARFGPKVSQIGPKLDISRTFSDQISVHFGLLDLKKSWI